MGLQCKNSGIHELQDTLLKKEVLGKQYNGIIQTKIEETEVSDTGIANIKCNPAPTQINIKPYTERLIASVPIT